MPLEVVGRSVRIQRNAVAACYRTVEGVVVSVDEEHFCVETSAGQHRFDLKSVKSWVLV